MNWRIETLAIVSLLTWGCEAEDTAPERAALAVPTAPVSAALEQAAPTPSIAETTAKIDRISPRDGHDHVHKEHPLEGLTAEFPWGDGKPGWTGTKATDPEPLREISNEEMLKRAMGDTPVQLDREHALVSVGRRRLPGAIDSFRKAIAHSEPLPVREMALSGMVEHGGPDALPIMWEMLRNDPTEQLRGQAIWAVALYGIDEARKAIDAGMADEGIGVRNMAVLAVWALKDSPDEAMSLLESAAQSDEQLIFQEALYNLSRMPWTRAGRSLSALALGEKSPKQKMAVYYYRTWVRKFPDLRK
ncbi:MAG: hypothetical protein ACI9U2_000110 [Bradymonadia bacterium]|jgi:hypothetical protein